MAAIDVDERKAIPSESIRDIVCSPEAQPPRCAKITDNSGRCQNLTAKIGIFHVIFCKFHAGLHEKAFFRAEAKRLEEIKVTYEKMREEDIRRTFMDQDLFHDLNAIRAKYDFAAQQSTITFQQLGQFRDAKLLGFSSNVAGRLHYASPQSAPAAATASPHSPSRHQPASSAARVDEYSSDSSDDGQLMDD